MRTLVGYEFAPKGVSDFQLSKFATTGGWAGGYPMLPPSPATSVFQDENGGSFIGLPSEQGIFALPFMPGSPAKISDGKVGDLGGFVASDQLPELGGGGGLGDLLGGMVDQLPAQLATDWFGKAAGQVMLGGASGGMLDNALGAMGIDNPLASGVMGTALNSAMSAAELGGPAASVLGNLMSGGGSEGAARTLGGAGTE